MRFFRINIAIKLISGTLFLVLLAILPVAYVTSQYFEETSKKKETDINLDYAVARATDTENILQSLLEKSRSIGSIYLLKRAGAEAEANAEAEALQQASDAAALAEANSNQAGVAHPAPVALPVSKVKAASADLSSTIEPLLENDRDIFAIDIYRSEGGDFKLEKSLIKRKMFKRMGADESLLERIRQKNPFPVDSVKQGQIEIMPVTRATTIPLMGFGVPLSKNDLGQIDAFAVTYFELSRLQRAFAEQNDRLTFLVDSRGQILAHPDESLVLSSQDYKSQPVVSEAIKLNSAPRGQISFSEKKTGWQGAYVRTAMGPVVVSQVTDASIAAPAIQATRQSIYIAGLVLSGAVFLVFLFSITLSSPIETLAGFIREVSKGNLDVSTKGKISSRDEVGELAEAFDDMVSGLRERAKAYSVMRQALGSSVVDTLMQMNETELGGQKKPITVLFSDLRDFTKFSEGHTPEEVVTMLNEYFDVMVKVIEKHGGWLDKFIGDAIMAVWGVPYTGDADESSATRAAIDMRLALAELNSSRLMRGLSPIKMGIGLHCGEAILGKIGAQARANLTVIGDTVNAASRIEASTKAFGADILLSDAMFEKLNETFLLEVAGTAEVKGKAEGLKLYKIRGYKNEDGEDVEVVTQWSTYAGEAVDKVKVS